MFVGMHFGPLRRDGDPAVLIPSWQFIKMPRRKRHGLPNIRDIAKR
jgi:hypothetical protein